MYSLNLYFAIKRLFEECAQINISKIRTEVLGSLAKEKQFEEGTIARQNIMARLIVSTFVISFLLSFFFPSTFVSATSSMFI